MQRLRGLMTKNYSYPIDLSWSTEEMTSVLHFLTRVELAYESQVSVTELLDSYAGFKAVVRSKGEERQIDRAFEEVSGYSTYRAVQAARQQEKGVLKLGR